MPLEQKYKGGVNRCLNTGLTTNSILKYNQKLQNRKGVIHRAII